MQVTLKNLIARYKFNKEMLEKYPEKKELFERKMKEAEDEILKYVTNDNFVSRLDYLNL